MSNSGNIVPFKSRTDFQRTVEEFRDDLAELFDRQHLKVNTIDTGPENGQVTVDFEPKKPESQDRTTIIALVNDISEEVAAMTGCETDCSYREGSSWSVYMFPKYLTHKR